MPLIVPNLDDRTYDDLVAEALTTIPQYAPLWTNHNPSDPGITIIELLAYFTEMLIYRLDRIGIEQKFNFYKLLVGNEFNDFVTQKLENLSVQEVDNLIKTAIHTLAEPQRAVTEQDFKSLVNLSIQNLNQNFSLRIDAVEAHCVFGKNLERADDSQTVNCPGHISLVVMAGRYSKTKNNENRLEEIGKDEYPSLLQEITNFIEPRCLLTTRLHLINPCAVWILLSVEIGTKQTAQQSNSNLRNICNDALSLFYDPFLGGKKGEGWSLGRNVYISELLELIEQIPLVDFIDSPRVEAIALTREQLEDAHTKVGIYLGINAHVGEDTVLGTLSNSHQDRLIVDNLGYISGIKLRSYELPKIVLQERIHHSGVALDARMRDDYV
jgi:hypothetical protein